MAPGWAALKRYVVARDRGICYIDGLPGATSADHIIPRSKGGIDHPSNLRACHWACNMKRGNHAIVIRTPRRSPFRVDIRST
jgi:5-methylcytosine-specific restriction endonuclease McrA